MKEYKCECGKIFLKANSLNAHYCWCLIHRNGKKPIDKIKNRNWRKGLTITDKRIKRNADSYKYNLENGITTHHFSGKHHSKETKFKLSQKANSSNNGYVKTKYYEVFSKYQNKLVKVQGTWELKYAEFLNANDINWIRDRKFNLKYRLFEDDYDHNYYPDFYLPDTDEFIEIKGFMWKSKDGRVDDKRKMEKVIEYNKNKKIRILMELDLKKLNII